ncbi:TPA: hypothetical protein KAL14_004219 [Escherichia coli]|nr:hypothetical protein [Escherichia coli]EHK3062947.1 hypothetical protein [Escherichia coli]EIY2726113.1 hypothetical protein [Escherichia coli]HBB8001725.1 hypothetical protein [Escherichia coli]HBB8031529.1 hypothetical protein [Escherichia coli]
MVQLVVLARCVSF